MQIQIYVLLVLREKFIFDHRCQMWLSTLAVCATYFCRLTFTSVRWLLTLTYCWLKIYFFPPVHQKLYYFSPQKEKSFYRRFTFCGKFSFCRRFSFLPLFWDKFKHCQKMLNYFLHLIQEQGLLLKRMPFVFYLSLVSVMHNRGCDCVPSL